MKNSNGKGRDKEPSNEDMYIVHTALGLGLGLILTCLICLIFER